jgi:cytochrome bd-type quinol oxidase subunit 1
VLARETQTSSPLFWFGLFSLCDDIQLLSSLFIIIIACLSSCLLPSAGAGTNQPWGKEGGKMRAAVAALQCREAKKKKLHAVNTELDAQIR